MLSTYCVYLLYIVTFKCHFDPLGTVTIPHFTDDAIEAQRDRVTCPTS